MAETKLKIATPNEQEKSKYRFQVDVVVSLNQFHWFIEKLRDVEATIVRIEHVGYMENAE